MDFAKQLRDHAYRNTDATLMQDAADEIDRLRGELRRIAEGNLGDATWQADYAKIRAVAAAALHPKE